MKSPMKSYEEIQESQPQSNGSAPGRGGGDRGAGDRASRFRRALFFGPCLHRQEGLYFFLKGVGFAGIAATQGFVDLSALLLT